MISKTLIVLTIVLSIVSINTVKAGSNIYDILDYDVDYEIKNDEIIAMDLHTSFTSLTVEILSDGNGFVELNVRCGLLVATFDDTNDIFYILIDGTESDYIEIDSGESTRILIIPFFANDQEIEILGTEVLSSDPSKIPRG